MADAPNDKKQDSAPARMEVEIARPTSVTSDVASGETSTRSLDSTTVDLDTDTGLGPEDQDEGSEQTSEPEPDAPDEEPDADALPDYDGSNEEVRAKYDEKFFTEAGTVNLPALSKEFFANEAKGEGKLNPGTYAYLKDVLGLDESAVKEVEAGQLARRTEANRAFYGRIDGGQSAYEAAVKWGVEGGYSDALSTGTEVSAIMGIENSLIGGRVVVR